NPPSANVEADAAAATPDRAGEAPELRTKLQQYEAEAVQAALESVGGKRAEAAQRLGMPLRALARKIKVLGIKKPGEERSRRRCGGDAPRPRHLLRARGRGDGRARRKRDRLRGGLLLPEHGQLDRQRGLRAR